MYIIDWPLESFLFCLGYGPKLGISKTTLTRPTSVTLKTFEGLLRLQVEFNSCDGIFNYSPFVRLPITVTKSVYFHVVLSEPSKKSLWLWSRTESGLFRFKDSHRVSYIKTYRESIKNMSVVSWFHVPLD